MSRFRLLSASALLLVLCCGSLALAQPAPSGAPAKRAEIEARIEKWRGEMLRTKVGLDEKTALEVERVLEKYRPERRRLQKELGIQKKTLRELIDLDSADQAAYKKALQAARDATQKLNALRVQEFDEVSKQLTPKQQAKLAQALLQAESKLRQALRKFHQKRAEGAEN